MPTTPETFETEFASCLPQLKSFILRFSGNSQDVEDIAQDTYIKSKTNLSSFSGRAALKTWIFAVAVNLCRDHFKTTQRWSIYCQDNARSDAFANPHLVDKMLTLSDQSAQGRFEIQEHIDFCFTCMSKTLPVVQQLAVILKDIYEFSIAEIQKILQLSEGKVKHALADGRNTLQSIFEAKCALVSKNGACHQCSELNNIFNPKQKKQEYLLIKKDQKNPKLGQDVLLKKRLEMIKKIDPLNAEGKDLHNYFLELIPGYSGHQS